MLALRLVRVRHRADDEGVLMAPIVILGGGLSGLFAAHLLQSCDRAYVLLEARPRLGGRILSAPALGAGAHDLGAAWFWPALHPQLPPLLASLGLASFAQYRHGDCMLERAGGQAPCRIASSPTEPPALRLVGGMTSLIHALQQSLPAHTLLTGQHATAVRLGASGQVEVSAIDGHGRPAMYVASHVLLALPPRLAACLDFAPGLPASLHTSWRRCASWMASHAKYVAEFEQPFWRARGLSGEAYSEVGLLQEIHDASPPSGGGALFGFVRLPAAQRQQWPPAAIRAQCRAQLQRLFGPAAATPRAEFYHDWASEPHTIGPDAAAPLLPPSLALPASIATGVWQPWLTGIGSEWSPRFPGYLAGALDAAQAGVARLLGPSWLNPGHTARVSSSFN